MTEGQDRETNERVTGGWESKLKVGTDWWRRLEHGCRVLEMWRTGRGKVVPDSIMDRCDLDGRALAPAAGFSSFNHAWQYRPGFFSAAREWEKSDAEPRHGTTLRDMARHGATADFKNMLLTLPEVSH